MTRYGRHLRGLRRVQDATGRPAEFVLAAADTFAAIGGALNPAPIQNATGTADAPPWRRSCRASRSAMTRTWTRGPPSCPTPHRGVA